MKENGTDCLQCKHYHWPQGPEDNDPTCDAFPDGIPGMIAFGEIAHNIHYLGDHGVLFESGKNQLEADDATP